ncbi:MAG: transglycosylase domain-containing protein, partial [Bacteroidota bacterium]|nr:transglycosylase domain-containing protein [Bacteroidota bacterium]
RPDDVQFDSRLDKDHFQITGYGKTDLRRLNGPFVYVPYEKGKPMPPRVIGPKNPYYTPLDRIAPDLRYAVMTAEDPSFYTNHGFVEESIRKSLATDYKNKKFKRGGSTISMQLVKNAFLSREKTLARKIEEILIVWLIENNHVMTKNRMLEVYFNIIEWGRNVYGIGEASRYYFGKTPAELKLGESIYLASIVPNPKAGLYAFLPNGTVRPGLLWYFNLIGKMMAMRGQALRDSSGYGFYDVHLKESLRKEIAPVDVAIADSLIKQSDDEDATPVVAEKKPNFFQRLFSRRDSTPKKVEPKKSEGKSVDPQVRVKAEIEKLKGEEKKKELLIDTAGKTRKEIRQERRRLRNEEKDKEKILKESIH